MSNTLNLGTDGNWATKEDSLLGYNSENGNFKPLPFSFSRDTSATVVNKDGLIETVGSGEPRIDFKDNTKGALLLEPTRTNTITYSNDFTLGGWQPVNVTVTSNYGISPDGTQNSTKLVFSDANTYFNRATASSGTETSSIYVKGIKGETIKFGKGNNVATGENHTLTGDWQRLIVTTTDAGTAFHISTFSGVTAREIEVFGAVQESGSYATSYIPTSGGVVTRSADSSSQTPPDGVIGQTEGTLFAEVKIDGLKDSNTIVTLHNGSFSEYLVISGNSVGNINAYIYAGGVQQVGIFAGTYAVNSVVKCAMAYKQNDVAFYINGLQIGTDSSATMASTSIFDVGSISFGNYPLHGIVKQAKLYNTRLSNSELQALTQ